MLCPARERSVWYRASMHKWEKDGRDARISLVSDLAMPVIDHRSYVCNAQPGRRVDAAQDRRIALGRCPFRIALMELHGTHRLSSDGGEADDHAVALRRGEGEVRGPLVKPRVEEAQVAPRARPATLGVV